MERAGQNIHAVFVGRSLSSIDYPDLPCRQGPLPNQQLEKLDMSLTIAHITPLISLLAGIPALLNYIVAIYLIVAGAVGLNEIYHFVS